MKVYVQNQSGPSNGILHRFCLTKGSTLTSQDYDPSSVVYVSKPTRAIWRYLLSEFCALLCCSLSQFCFFTLFLYICVSYILKNPIKKYVLGSQIGSVTRSLKGTSFEIRCCDQFLSKFSIIQSNSKCYFFDKYLNKQRVFINLVL